MPEIPEINPIVGIQPLDPPYNYPLWVVVLTWYLTRKQRAKTYHVDAARLYEWIDWLNRYVGMCRPQGRAGIWAKQVVQKWIKREMYSAEMLKQFGLVATGFFKE
jgi:hypothetical protein